MPKPRDPTPLKTDAACGPALRLVGVEDWPEPRGPERAPKHDAAAEWGGSGGGAGAWSGGGAGAGGWVPEVVVRAKRGAPAGPQAQKPTPDFPLTAHPRRGWIKKVRGKQMCFGPLSDPWGALERYTAFAAGHRDTLVAAGSVGVGVRVGVGEVAAVAAANRASAHLRPEGLLVRDIANAFVTHHKGRLDTGQIKPRTFADFMRSTEILVTTFGATTPVASLGPADFGVLRKTLEERTESPGKLNQLLVRVRSVFKFAEEEGLIPRHPAYGSNFKKPPRSAERRRRAERGQQMFSRDEIRTLLSAAEPVMRAMILLGINGGMGNSDLSLLRDAHLVEGGTLIRFPRPKTGIDRCIPLLPETVEAVRTARALRPRAATPDLDDRVFLTRHGNPWVKTRIRCEPGRVTPLVSANNAISANFKKLCRRCGLPRTEGVDARGFYALRHTFRTVVDECPDRPAIDLVMGHENANDMSVTYREHIGLDRVLKVVEYVRRWLFESPADSTLSAPAAPNP